MDSNAVLSLEVGMSLLNVAHDMVPPEVAAGTGVACVGLEASVPNAVPDEVRSLRKG